MSHKVILVEDEMHQQQLIADLLSHFPEFQLEGIATTIQQGKQMIESIKPDLALLDVMISSDTSFELLNSLDKISFGVIFITSYDHFAVQAFRQSAIDYLLKPIAYEELARALEKFKQAQRAHDYANIQNLLANLQLPAVHVNKNIALPTLTGFLYIAINDILRCESDNTYTTFFLLDKRKIVVSKTLKEVEQMLEGYRFFRIHNSHLINLEYITEYIKGEGGMVKMKDGSTIDVSRRRKDEFLHQLKKQ